MDELTTEFRSPGVAWRGKPFWSWNGELDEAELLRQVHVMKEMGLGGFFMHSRTGLVTEYLGDEWFRLTNVCADEAEKLGMEAWLYDEDRWPSGTAGGMVTEKPEHRSKYLSLRKTPGAEFAWQDGIVAAFACDLDELAYTNSVRIGSETLQDSYQDKTILVFTVEPMNPSSFYNGNTYVDTLSREATEYYIELTHERYKERCGDRLGRSIQGIFTDEPHRGASFAGFGISNENRYWMTPWTEKLPAHFQSQFGYDLIDHLPELFLMPGGEAVRPVKWQYMELLQQMFLDNFAKPLYDWCSANKMFLTGHVLHEDNLTAQVALQGSLMRFYEYMHYPGVDVLTEGNRNYVIVKQLTSAARQLGQTWLLSELYGCTGWQMNFESHKAVGDWQALFGINLRCHHLSWYTMEGEAKRDYPASILHQSAWWKDYEYVESYYARLGLLMARGKPCCDLLVLNPVESVWCRIRVGWAEHLRTMDPAIQQLERQYAELSAWLLGAQLDYDYGDEDMVGRLTQIVKDEQGRPVFRVGEAEYRAVVAGGMTTMRAGTLRLLNEFAAAGGTVIFAGEPPPYIDALPSAGASDLAAQTSHVPWEQDEIVAACRRSVREWVEITDAETGAPLTQIYCQLRAEGETRSLVAINVHTTQGFDHVQVRIHGQANRYAQEWDCRTGERYSHAAEFADGVITFLTSLPATGERAFLFTPDSEPGLLTVPDDTTTAQKEVSGPFDYTLGEENVCVLDIARYQIGDGASQDALEVLKIDRAVRSELNLDLRGGEMVQPWFHRKFHPAPPVLTQVTMTFDFLIETLPDGPVTLCIERPSQWTLTLNGQPLPSQADGWWVDAAFQKVAVPLSLLKTGPNELTLVVDFHEGVNIEAVYLIGAFGVNLSGTEKTLTRLPEQIAPGDLTTQGFPFYGGALTYHVPLPTEAAQAGRVFIETPEFEAACVKVGAGGITKMIAWQPYKAEVVAGASVAALEVVLTRRNTFGPLHQVPLRAGAYGPGNFVTAGDGFSEDYMLYPAGLLAAPIVSWTN